MNMNALNTQIYEEATEWIIHHRSDDLDADAKRRFDAWLRESPQHLRAYLEMSTIWEDVPTLNREWNPGADELIVRARAEANIFPLDLREPGTGTFGVVGAIPEGTGETPLLAPSALRDLEAVKVEVDEPMSPEVHLVPLELVAASKEPELRSVPVVTVAASQSMRTKVLAIAATLILTAGVTAWFYLQRGLYTTDIGEQRTLALEDGSTVELNALTKIRITYSDNERSIELLQGQALFKVAKDPSRPFIVDSDGTRVRAVGTQFDVYRKITGTQVTVVEGRVAVATLGRAQATTTGGSPSTPESPDPGTIGAGTVGAARADKSDDSANSPRSNSHVLQAEVGELLLSAGEQVLIAQNARTPQLALGGDESQASGPRPQASVTASAVVPKAANVEAATAWTQQRLVFDVTPLTEVAQEFNRYNRRPLIIDDPALAKFNISGSFSSTDPALLLRFLRDQPGIVVHETTDEIRISREDTHG